MRAGIGKAKADDGGCPEGDGLIGYVITKKC